MPFEALKGKLLRHVFLITHRCLTVTQHSNKGGVILRDVLRATGINGSAMFHELRVR